MRDSLARLLLVALLPALLLLAAGLGLGCYYETNDDLTFVALVRGVSAAAPVTNLYLYFRGYAAVWAVLYAVFPAVPWYGLTFYALLYGATVLVFALLERLLRPHLARWPLTAVLVVFFLVAWLEHGFWFNYVRVPLLLAGAGGLYLAGRPRLRWPALLLGAALLLAAGLVRPSIAVLGTLAAAPAIWWLGGPRRAGLVLGGQLLALAGLNLVLSQGPVAASYRRFDGLVASFNDFQLASPPPHLRPPDQLALAAARQWMYADSTLTSPAFFGRALLVRPAHFLRHTAPAKLAQTAGQLARDYFPLLLLLLLTAAVVWQRPPPGRHLFWLVQAGFGVGLLTLGTVLKLPPRLAQPVLDFWLLGNLVFVGRFVDVEPPNFAAGRAWPPRLAAVLLLGAVGAYALKTAHRYGVLRQERANNTQHRQRVLRQASGTNVLVTNIMSDTYKAASPFSSIRFPPGLRVLSVAGWSTFNPSQPRLWAALTGTRAFVPALGQLARRPDVAWVLTSAAAGQLNAQLAAASAPYRLEPAAGSALYPGVKRYYPVPNGPKAVVKP